ncbi:ABC transporter substrate-binding protein [Saccharopolyspora sp. 5N708]|uniref:ABC transporter substrate-binding protein n=1 Tax=Saccharopolyspora sp. 5N708 TaxID=3457424 RepID=UPI003FD28A4B
MKYRRKAVCLLLTAAVFLLGGCGALSATNVPGSGATESGLVPITAGVAASQSSTAVLVGLQRGFFARNGIDLTLGRAATGAGAITQVINGQQQVALGGISPVVIAASSRIPVQIVSGAVADRPSPQGAQYQTMVAGNSPIRSFRDLAGRTVAVNSLKCCWEFWIREAIEKDGGNPASVHLVQLSFPDQVTALEQGKVDAISTAQPYATALRQKGYRDIGDSPAVAYADPNADNTVFFMAKSFIDQHPGIVERWRKAVRESSEYANAHPDETRKAIVQQTSADPALVAMAPLPFYTAELNRQVIEKEAAFAVKYGVLDAVPGYETYVVP